MSLLVGDPGFCNKNPETQNPQDTTIKGMKTKPQEIFTPPISVMRLVLSDHILVLLSFM